MNKNKSDQEKRAMVQLVQSQLVGLKTDLMGVVSRHFIQEGIVSEIPDATSGVEYGRHRRLMYLFDDILIIARNRADRKGRHEVHHEFLLTESRCDIVRSGETLVLTIKGNTAGHSEVFACVAQSNDETSQWLDAIKDNALSSSRRLSSFA